MRKSALKLIKMSVLKCQNCEFVAQKNLLSTTTTLFDQNKLQPLRGYKICKAYIPVKDKYILLYTMC
jgi:hypothetical protein